MVVDTAPGGAAGQPGKRLLCKRSECRSKAMSGVRLLECYRAPAGPEHLVMGRHVTV